MATARGAAVRIRAWCARPVHGRCPVCGKTFEDCTCTG